MFQENVPLSEYSNYKIGGPAKFFVLANTSGNINDAVSEAKSKKIPILILGGGTNILFSDSGFDGFVIKPNLKTVRREENNVRVGAGATVEELLSFTVKESLSGLEWAGGLPGTVGGAIWGNAGAFGGEIKDQLIEVTSLNISAEKPEVIVRRNNECNFSYRSSIFKINDQSYSNVLKNIGVRNREVILAAMFELTPGDPKKIKELIDEKIQYRKNKQPLEYPNIGSIFKNIDVKKLPKEVAEKYKQKIKLDPFPVLPTAVLNDAAGLKNTRVGDAVVSEKHPNFIINAGHATEKDVKAVMEIVKKRIKEQFGVELEQEVIFV